MTLRPVLIGLELSDYMYVAEKPAKPLPKGPNVVFIETHISLDGGLYLSKSTQPHVFFSWAHSSSGGH